MSALLFLATMILMLLLATSWPSPRDHLRKQADRLAERGARLRAEGDDQAALPVLARAVGELEGLLGRYHPDLSDPLCHLGEALVSLGHHDEAERTLQRALRLSRHDDPIESRVSSALARIALERDEARLQVSPYRSAPPPDRLAIRLPPSRPSRG